MKKINLCMKLFTSLLVMGFVPGVWAGEPYSMVSLVPTSPIKGLVNGDTVTFDVYINFFFNSGTLGGGFDVVFDSDALAYVDLVSADLGDPTFQRDPDDLPGRLQSWAVGDFNGDLASSGPTLVGSVAFDVLSTMGSTTTVSVTSTAGIGGPWVSDVDYQTLLSPVYNQVVLLSESLFSDSFESAPTE